MKSTLSTTCRPGWGLTDFKNPPKKSATDKRYWTFKDVETTGAKYHIIDWTHLFLESPAVTAKLLFCFSFFFLLQCNGKFLRHCQYRHLLIWPTSRDGYWREKDREAFWPLGLTLKYGKQPMAELQEDKLIQDLPSRLSLGRLDVMPFKPSTSSWNKEDSLSHSSTRLLQSGSWVCEL